MNWACTAIEPISAQSRESGNPGPRTRPKNWVPACAPGHAHILRAARRASPLPSPCELLRAVGRGRGWGVLFRPSTWLNWHVPYPARHLRRRIGLEVGNRFRSNTGDPRGPPPPTPPHHSQELAGGGERRGPSCGLQKMCAWPSASAGTNGIERRFKLRSSRSRRACSMHCCHACEVRDTSPSHCPLGQPGRQMARQM